jgi:hypothetical protein
MAELVEPQARHYTILLKPAQPAFEMRTLLEDLPNKSALVVRFNVLILQIARLVREAKPMT